MPLNCQMTTNLRSIEAGGTPAQATLTVYNPGAVAVVVTGVALAFTDNNNLPIQSVRNPSVVPIGPGQTTSVPAGGSINIGPFPMTFGSAASASSFAMVPPGSQPSNPQGSARPQQTINVGGLVYGSDGSVNPISPATVLVSGSAPPPLGYQGGVANFAGPNNANLIAAGVA